MLACRRTGSLDNLNDVNSEGELADFDPDLTDPSASSNAGTAVLLHPLLTSAAVSIEMQSGFRHRSTGMSDPCLDPVWKDSSLPSDRLQLQIPFAAAC